MSVAYQSEEYPEDISLVGSGRKRFICYRIYRPSVSCGTRPFSTQARDVLELTREQGGMRRPVSESILETCPCHAHVFLNAELCMVCIRTLQGRDSSNKLAIGNLKFHEYTGVAQENINEWYAALSRGRFV